MNITFFYKERFSQDVEGVDNWPSASFVPQIGTDILVAGGQEYTVSSVRFSGPDIVDVRVDKPSRGFQLA